MSAIVLSLSIVAWPLQATATPLVGSHGSHALAMAKKKKKRKRSAPKDQLTPELAESQRNTVRGQAQLQRDAGDHEAAAETLSSKGRELGDPVLFVDAAESLKIAGEEARDEQLVKDGIEEARIGLDILYFLLDERADPDRKYLNEASISSQIDRAKDLIAKSEALIAEIESEKNKPPEPEPEPEKQRKPGRGMIIAGSVLTGLGVAGLGVMGAGLGIGASAQSQVNDPTIYGTTFDAVDARGKTGNLLAYVGAGVGVVGLAAGVTLLVLGIKKKNAAGGARDDESARLRVAPMFSANQGGLVLSGRF